MTTPNYLPPDELSPEERLDALVEVLAEGIIFLADKGELKRLAAGEFDRDESGDGALTSGENEGIRSCAASGADGGGEADGGENGTG